MSNNQGCGWLIGIFFLSPFIIPLLIYIVLPITLITIGCIAIAGVTSATYVASKNFGAVLIEAHKTIK